MTHREAKIERARCDVRQQESRVLEAEENLKHGQAKALAEYNREASKLKAELERAKIELEAEKAYLRSVEDNLTDASGDL